MSTFRPPTHQPVLGILLKLVSVVFFASMAACVKYLGRDVPSGETIFVRGLIAVAVIVFIARRTYGLSVLKAGNWRAHARRSLSGTVSMFSLYTALTLIPLAQVTAITFAAPMFLTVLAMLFLGERVHHYRWTALAIGFAGVLIIVGPQLGVGTGSAVGVALAVTAAGFSALAKMFLRGMSSAGGEPVLRITFYFALTSMLAGASTALAGWPMPTSREWLFIVLAGVFGTFGQLLMTTSYAYAEASVIAPLDYTNLLMAVFYGYVFFDEVPRWSTWIGAPLVIAAGLIILWREYRKRVPARPVNGGRARIRPSKCRETQ